ncbi:hypothetical protein J3A83DRAFT_1637988 [Scleroderma citrinum]
MGSTGVGKSSFIHNSAPPGLCTVKVGHGLQSETSEAQPVCWVTQDGTTVKLVDTPGFDDSRVGMTDTQVLRMIADFLTNEYKRGKSQLTGLIYVHRISDTRVGRTSQRNLRMFRKLCGDESLKNVVIITTMWDMITLEDGLRHEQELMSNDNLFKPLLDKGAIMMRHDRTPKSATNVIDYLLGKDATTIQIVVEIVEQGKALQDTAAGTELHSEIRELMRKHREEVESMEAEMCKMQTVSTEERQEMNREMQIKLADNRKGMDQEGQREFTEERQRTEGTMAKLLMELDELKRGLTGTSDPPPVYEPGTSDFPAPETKCVVHCSKLLQLVKQYEASLARACPDVPISVASCTIHFADAVERSVTCIGHTSASLKSALTLEDMYSLQQFMRADPYPRTFTLGTWAKAQHDMKIVINDIEAILSTYRKPGFADRFRNGKGIKRSSALNAILESTKEVAADMATMVDWWSPIIDAIGNVEDAAQHEREGTGFPDSTAMASLTRIIRALDAYCEAYAKCPETLHEAAVGISL